MTQLPPSSNEPLTDNNLITNSWYRYFTDLFSIITNTIDGLAEVVTNGIIVRTGTDEYAARTLTAGSSKILITNGDGVSGNPSVDVVESNLSYNNITTGLVSGANGGTGVANTGKTITLGGNWSQSGSHNLTFTTTAATSVTFPTSGTLVNSAVTTLSSLTSIGNITSGSWNGSVIGTQYGGTGANLSGGSNGQIPIWNGSSYSNGYITAGTGISVTNGAGSVTINNTGPSVDFYNYTYSGGL